MKKKILLMAMTFCGSVAFAQKDNVGIGTIKPDQSAVLDLSSSNKGLLTPRMSLQQRNLIQNPAEGLIVYQTDMLSGFYFYDGKEWKTLTTQNSVAGTDGDWTLIGNVATATDFIGTTNNMPLKFKTNNQASGEINPTNSSTFFGFQSGGSNTGIGNTAMGAAAMYSNNGGVGNVAVGYESLAFNVTGGNENVGVGAYTLRNNTTGKFNMAIGTHSLRSNLTGENNAGIGYGALNSLTSGDFNMAIGSTAMYARTSGSNNAAIGAAALKNNLTGSNNTAIGTNAGFNNTGSSNIFIGYNAGVSETGSDKLYIANTNTATPLVYGDFSTKYLAVGEVAAADRAAATSGGYRLLVKGGMITEKIKVAVAGTTDWADYVFENDYKIMPLTKVEAFIKENKHLPNVPSTKDMIANGNDLQKTDAKLLEKIEELTLYVIELNKEIQKLKVENQSSKK